MSTPAPAADMVIQAIGDARHPDGDILDIFPIAAKGDQQGAARAREPVRIRERPPGAPYETNGRWHRQWLWIRIFDLDPGTIAELLRPTYRVDDESGELVPDSSRAYRVIWRSLPGMTSPMIARIEARGIEYDPRMDLPIYDALEIAELKP